MGLRLLISHLLFILLVSEVVVILPEIYRTVNAFVKSNHLGPNKSDSNLNGSSGIISEPPNLILLQQPPVKLFEMIVGHQLVEFGTLLLDDASGNIVHAIKEDEKKTQLMCREICRRWLEGKGRQPVTWGTLINILHQVQLRELATDIQSFVNDEILNVPVSPNNSFVYSETIMNAAKVLKSMYQHQSIIEFNPLHHPSMPFINLIMKSHGRRVTLSRMLSDLNLDTSQRILITGKPGAGKTTLMRYLARGWAEGRTLQSCQILFLIRLGQLQRNGIYSLTDLLTTSHKDLMGINNIAAELTVKLGAGACFLVDAYDEWYHQEDFMKNLMFHNHLKYALRILTSRTVYESNVKIGMKSVSVTGFDAKNLEHYLHKLAMNDSRVIQSVLSVWKAHPKVQQMCTIPLHMAMIIAISKCDGDRSIQTRTQIYTAFMNATIKHYHKFHSDWNSISLRNCILSSSSEDSGLCTAFKTLHKVAFQMIFNGTNVFPEYHDVKVNIRNLGFVDMIKVDTNPDQVRYVFSHPTFVEFFAALHLTTLSQEKQNYYITLYASGRSFIYLNDFWNFFFGLTGDIYLLSTSSVSDLLHQIRSRYTHKLSSGVCDYELEMQFFKFIQEIRWTGEALGKLLLSAKVVTNSSLCMEYTDNVTNENDFIVNVLKSSNVHRFQLSTRIRLNESLFSYWISVTLENQTNTLDEEYLKLMLCLTGDSNCVTVPSVTSFSIRTWRMSDNLRTFICSITKHCINMAMLHVEVISEPSVTEIRAQRNSLLKLIMDLSPIQFEKLTLSMDCCLLSAVLGELGEYVRARHLHLVLSKCHFVDNNGYFHMVGEMWDQYREWIFGQSVSHGCRTVPVDSAFKNLNMLQSLTVDSPVNDGDFKVLLMELKYLQHFRLISVDKRTMNQVLEYLSHNANLETLEISHTSLRNNEIEKLCKNLPQNLHEFSLHHTNLDDYQISLLSNALKSLHELTTLDLSSDFISNKSLICLLDGLKANRHLRSLDLSFNEIDEQHIDLLTQLQTLHHLNIQGYALPPTCKDSLMRMFLNLHELQSFCSCILFFNDIKLFYYPYLRDVLQLHLTDDKEGGHNEDSDLLWSGREVYGIKFNLVSFNFVAQRGYPNIVYCGFGIKVNFSFQDNVHNNFFNAVSYYSNLKLNYWPKADVSGTMYHINKGSRPTYYCRIASFFCVCLSLYLVVAM